MKVRDIVSLTDADREALQQFVPSGSDKHKRAQILLACSRPTKAFQMRRWLVR